MVNQWNSGRVTIYDVAREAGVSKSLVSLVLHGDDRVSEARRNSVLQAIEKLGYQPSRAAKALAGKSSKTIGVIVEDYSNAWFIRMIHGLREVFDELGYQITVSDLHQSGTHLDDPLDAFLSMHVDGLILAVEPSELRNRPIPIPCVIMGDRSSASMVPNADLVTNDDFQGGKEITEHLLKLGHTQIGHISSYSGPAQLRMRGYLEAMKQRGLETYATEVQLRPTAQNGYQGMKALLETQPGLTAVFASNDTMASGAFAYLREQKLAVPEDFSLVGYDNSGTSSKYMLNLTTVDYAGPEIGREAAKLILDRIADPDHAPKRIVLPSPLVFRKSTKAL